MSFHFTSVYTLEWNAGSYGCYVWCFWETPNYFPKEIYHFIFSPTVYEGSNFFPSCPVLVIICFLIIAILVVVKWYLTVVLICISPRVLGDVPGGSAGKDSVCGAGDLGSIPGLGRSPGEGNWLPTPVFCHGEFCGLYSPWSHKESGMTARLSFPLSLPRMLGIFSHLLPLHISSLEKCPFTSLDNFLFGLFAFCCCCWTVSFLYVFWIRVSCQIHDLQKFTHSVGFSFSW